MCKSKKDDLYCNGKYKVKAVEWINPGGLSDVIGMIVAKDLQSGNTNLYIGGSKGTT